MVLILWKSMLMVPSIMATTCMPVASGYQDSEDRSTWSQAMHSQTFCCTTLGSHCFLPGLLP